jgi:hypothetical protein
MKFGKKPDEEEAVGLASPAGADPVALTLCYMQLKDMMLRKSIKSTIIERLASLMWQTVLKWVLFSHLK